MVDKTIRELSKNKTPSSDGLYAEHLIHALALRLLLPDY